MKHNPVQNQFDTRSTTFNDSANWVTDRKLIERHARLAGKPSGMALELCCGTGMVGSSLVKHGWRLIGVDISPEMLKVAMQYFPVQQHTAESLPFRNGEFSLVVMRQALFFLNEVKVFREIRRVLKKNGTLILSQTVPFSDLDAPWLKKIHTYKQAQMLKFYKSDDLEGLLKHKGFRVAIKDRLTVRESITKWMRNAPELSEEKRREVCRLVADAPPEYKKMRRVKTVNQELFEDWNWVIFKAIKKS